MPLELILNIVIIVLLVPTIIYAVILNNRLTALRRNRDDLAKVVSSFNEATVRAESGIPRLRKAAEDAGETLQEQVERSQALRDDLAFMIERGESMANRLEGAVRAARSETKPSMAPPQSAVHSAAGQSAPVQPQPRTAAEALQAGGLGQTVEEAAAGPRFGPAEDARDPMSRDTMSRDATSRDSGPGEAGPDFKVEDERSEAERELLRALQSAR